MKDVLAYSILGAGAPREIPEPLATTQTQATQRHRRSMSDKTGAAYRTPSPVPNPGMHLKELWRDIDNPGNVGGKRQWYGKRQKRR